MQAQEIKLEIDRIVPHQTHCKTIKPEPGECNCNHDAVVTQLNDLVYLLIKKIK